MFSYSLPLCQLLQKIEIDLKRAIELAEVSVIAMQRLRDNIDDNFK